MKRGDPRDRDGDRAAWKMGKHGDGGSLEGEGRSYKMGAVVWAGGAREDGAISDGRVA